MINRELKHLLEIYKQKRFSEIPGIPTDRMLKVDSEEVAKVMKKNYSYLNCTCSSSGKTGHNSLCRHKQFFIMFPLLEFVYKNMDKLINYYELIRKLKKDIDPFTIIDDLKKFQRI